jgi:hypothetical protein
MLVMLIIGIPLYTCATASTPIAAAFLLKGISPGAVLVFLLVGPATNIASLTVLAKLIGRHATLVYLAAISVVSVLCGLAVDQLYAVMKISAQATVGKAGEITPMWLQIPATMLLIGLSLGHLAKVVRARWKTGVPACSCPPGRPEQTFMVDQQGKKEVVCGNGCGCTRPDAQDRKERGCGNSGLG